MKMSLSFVLRYCRVHLVKVTLLQESFKINYLIIIFIFYNYYFYRFYKYNEYLTILIIDIYI